MRQLGLSEQQTLTTNNPVNQAAVPLRCLGCLPRRDVCRHLRRAPWPQQPDIEGACWLTACSPTANTRRRKNRNAAKAADMAHTAKNGHIGGLLNSPKLAQLFAQSSASRRTVSKDAMITLEQLYTCVEEQYFSSHDFNGLPIYNIEGVTLAEVRPIIRRGVELEYFQVEVSNNPHIKFTASMDKSHQLVWLDSVQFTDFACLYPHPSKLKNSLRIGTYEDRPYSKALALGDGQFDFKTFDVSVLEHYRNDPRYYYETDFIHGQICITTEHYNSDAMQEHDKVLLST